MAVPLRDMPDYSASAAQIAAPASSLALALPLQTGANHLLGYVMRGVLHYQWSPLTADIDLTNRFYTYRNPNCDYLYCWALLNGVTDNGASLTVTAGNGTPVTTAYADRTMVAELIAPWDSNDSGYHEVTYFANNCAVRAIMICELYRQELGAGDDYIAEFDAAYRHGGLLESQKIIQSASAGPGGIITEIDDAWNNGVKQAVSWSTGSDRPSTAAESWTNPLANSWTFTHRARANKTGTNTTDYTVWAYTNCTIGTSTEYSWRMSSGTDTVTKTGLTNVVGAWTYVTGLAVSNAGDDTLTFEMQIDANPGVVYVNAISVVEGTYAP